MELPPITSSQNRQLSQVRRLLARPKECRKEGLLVADGVHLVQEAIAARLRCDSLLIAANTRDSEITALQETAGRLRLPVYQVLDHLFRNISPMETPQGILGVFERPRADRARVWNHGERGGASGHLVVAHGLQDPTNVGSLTRSALASGLRALITTPGTVDPFHHRALRASMGAAFHLPILVEESTFPLISILKNLGYRTVGFSPRGDTELNTLDPAVSTALFLGSEGAGLDSQVLESMDLRVRIPMQPEVESLGVAAAGAVAFFWLRLASRNGRGQTHGSG